MRILLSGKNGEKLGKLGMKKTAFSNPPWQLSTLL